MRGDLNYILLDVVYETNPYVNIQETNISHFLLIEGGSPIQVTTPKTIGSFYGSEDKLLEDILKNSSYAMFTTNSFCIWPNTTNIRD